VLGARPVESPWIDAARAICDGDLVRAADIIDDMGHTAAAAHARLRAAEAFADAGLEVGAATQRAQAESFYWKVGAAGFIRNGDGSASASADTRRASSQR